MRKTLKDLFLAILNATLILVAVVLFLLVLVLTKANSLSATFAQNLAVTTPLSVGIETINTEVSGMRADIAALGTQSQGISLAKLDRLETKFEKMETQLAEIQVSMSTIAETPTRLLDHAMASAADQTVAGLARINVEICIPQE